MPTTAYTGAYHRKLETALAARGTANAKVNW